MRNPEANFAWIAKDRHLLGIWPYAFDFRDCVAQV
jgi:hypothetical protein